MFTARLYYLVNTCELLDGLCPKNSEVGIKFSPFFKPYDAAQEERIWIKLQYQIKSHAVKTNLVWYHFPPIWHVGLMHPFFVILKCIQICSVFIKNKQRVKAHTAVEESDLTVMIEASGNSWALWSSLFLLIFWDEERMTRTDQVQRQQPWHLIFPVLIGSSGTV